MDADELRALPPLEAMSDEGLARISACSARLDAEPGQVIAMSGDRGSGMYILLDGSVAVELRGATIDLGPGDFFGELALLVDAGARVARVRATTPVRCLSIPREDFLRLVETEPSFALHLLRELARRLTEARSG
jgi:CRP-like cAMP-binding protein